MSAGLVQQTEDAGTNISVATRGLLRERSADSKIVTSADTHLAGVSVSTPGAYFEFSAALWPHRRPERQ